MNIRALLRWVEEVFSMLLGILGLAIGISKLPAPHPHAGIFALQLIVIGAAVCLVDATIGVTIGTYFGDAVLGRMVGVWVGLVIYEIAILRALVSSLFVWET